MGGCLSKKQKKVVKHLNKGKHLVQIKKEHVDDVEQKVVKQFNKEKHVGQIQKEHVANVEQKEVNNLNKQKHVGQIEQEHVSDVDEKEAKHLNEKPVKYENRVWFYDELPNPSATGKPQWTPYDDITSTVIETHFQRFCNGSTRDKTVVINSRYKVDVKKYFQIKMDDVYCQRRIKRGNPNQRGKRPTNWRFTNAKILINTKGSGCGWLRDQYYKKYGIKSITEETVLQGILDEQKIQNAPRQSQQDNLKLATLLKRQQEAWRLIFNFHNITDESIKEIINYQNTEESDAARSAILKIYTYETDLYKQLNNANCIKDESKIKTLGPFSFLLYQTLSEPPIVNSQDVIKLCDDNDQMILFRGLSLDKEVITFYKKLAQTGEYFKFNGFTSTSVEVKVASTFAKKYAKDGQLPCILALKVFSGINKVYLNTAEYSAFPNEKEVLLGNIEWKVESVSVKNEFTIIKLKERGVHFNFT